MFPYTLYLAGSIRIWQEQFVPKYASHFNHSVGLFEPGRLNIPPDHTHISPQVTQKCVEEITKADAIISYMKPYVPSEKGGVPGIDSSWECGFACGLGKPVIALIDDVAHFQYFEDQWMLSHNKTAFITLDPEIAHVAKESSHYDDPQVIVLDAIENIEHSIINFLTRISN